MATACENRVWLRHRDKTMMRRAMEGWNSGAFCAAVFPTPVDAWGSTIDFGAGDDPDDDTLGEPVTKLGVNHSMWMLFSTDYPPVAVYRALAALGFEVAVMWNDVNGGYVGRFTHHGGEEQYEYASRSDLDQIPRELVEEFSLDDVPLEGDK